MNIEEKFNEFYNKLLIDTQNSFDEIEHFRQNSIKERKQNKFLTILSIIVCLSLTIIISKFFDTKNNEDIESIAMFVLNLTWILPAFIAIFRRKKMFEYDKIYKEKVISNLIKYFSHTLSYHPDEGLSSEDLKEIEFNCFNRFYSSNLIKGIYLNDEINISAVNSYYKAGTSSRSTTRAVFYGLLTKFKLPENSNLNLYLKNKKGTTPNLIQNFTVDINQISTNNTNINFLKNTLTKIEINKLNDIFDIYSSNPELTTKILDPFLTEKLIDIFNKTKFEIYIKDYYIYMKFWIEGLFSIPTPEKEIFEKTVLFKNFEILYIIFDLISTLKKQLNF